MAPGSGAGASSAGAVVGVVYDPSKDELWQAVRGGGAVLNGAPLACSSVSSLAGALVGTGFGYDERRRAAQARILRGVDHLRFADSGDHALGDRGVGRRLLATQVQVFAKRELRLPSALEDTGVEGEYVGLVVHFAPWNLASGDDDINTRPVAYGMPARLIWGVPALQ